MLPITHIYGFKVTYRWCGITTISFFYFAQKNWKSYIFAVTDLPTARLAGCMRTGIIHQFYVSGL